MAQRHLAAERWDQAKPFLEEALSVLEKAYGSDHQTVAQMLIFLDELDLARQEYAQAGEIDQKAR